mmetsp:Transcript_10376/g.36143  ORF Transcript_10376/g.36143 Transcript_10376/m.36143 type:complete len:144 (+) Transcript_10376:1553-1984(+)
MHRPPTPAPTTTAVFCCCPAEAAAARAAEAEREERERAEAAARRRAEKASALAAEGEPEAGPGVALVAVRLPDGTRRQRRFRDSEPVRRVYDFVDSLEGLDMNAYQLQSNYPRKVLARDDGTGLKEAGLAPQAMLFVQNLDDE